MACTAPADQIKSMTRDLHNAFCSKAGFRSARRVNEVKNCKKRVSLKGKSVRKCSVVLILLMRKSKWCFFVYKAFFFFLLCLSWQDWFPTEASIDPPLPFITAWQFLQLGVWQQNSCVQILFIALSSCHRFLWNNSSIRDKNRVSDTARLGYILSFTVYLSEY